MAISGIDTGYVPKVYPKVVYHRTGRSGLVNDPAQERGMGADWADKPWPVADPPVKAAVSADPALQAKYDALLAENAELKKNITDIQDGPSKYKLTKAITELQEAHLELKKDHQELLAVVAQPAPAVTAPPAK